MDALKAKCDSRRFEFWKMFFKFREGARTPGNEIQDLLAARQLYANSGSKWAELRDFMLWPPEVTPEEMEGRREDLKAKLTMLGKK